MPFSHHSHSGQFCPGHARNTLEEMVQMAISKKFWMFGLTEHMPRHDTDAYPEEKDAGNDLQWHFQNEASYFEEASRLRDKYAGQINLPIGFECDWIRPESRDLILKSINTYAFDYFIGSVHHVHTIPIDYDAAMYRLAREKAGGSDTRLFEDYFDAQLEMLKSVRPPIVGHFDLIRLKSDEPNASFSKIETVWKKVLRNLSFISSYHGILEINTAALRKGMSEPYPQMDICQVAFKMNIRFCLSDDSHGTDHIAYGYHPVLNFIQEIGIQDVHYVWHTDAVAMTNHDARFRAIEIRSANIANLNWADKQ